MTPARELSGGIAGCLVGAALVLVSSSANWADGVASRGAGLPVETVALTSSDIAPAASGLALVALASVAALVATRGRVRGVVGAMLVVTGGVVTLVALQARARAHDVAQAEMSGASDLQITLQPWSWLAATGGVLIAAAGLLTVVRSRTWPSMSRRYDARSQRAADQGPDGTPESLWSLLDRGHDPTDD